MIERILEKINNPPLPRRQPIGRFEEIGHKEVNDLHEARSSRLSHPEGVLLAEDDVVRLGDLRARGDLRIGEDGWHPIGWEGLLNAKTLQHGDDGYCKRTSIEM